MREIKFRAWGPNSKHMWSHEDLKGCAVGWLFEPNSGDKIIMQFTGLHDRTGKEIYEGDVVRVSQAGVNYSADFMTGIVEQIDGCFTVSFSEPIYDISLKVNRKSLYVKCFTVNRALEVIGNIYESPELLKKEA